MVFFVFPLQPRNICVRRAYLRSLCTDGTDQRTMTGWPRIPRVQRRKNDVVKTRAEEVRDDNSVTSKLSQVLTDVASSLGFESVISSQASMLSPDKSSRWERFTGMLERRMSQPQLDNALINVKLRVSRSQRNESVHKTLVSARCESPASVSSQKLAPSPSIHNASNTNRCSTPTTPVSRKSVSFEAEVARPVSPFLEIPRTFDAIVPRESPLDHRDDSAEQGRKIPQKKAIRPPSPFVVRKPLTDGNRKKSVLSDFDRYKPTLSADESSLVALDDQRSNGDGKVKRGPNQSISLTPQPSPRQKRGSASSVGSDSNARSHTKKTNETMYDFKKAFPTYQKQQKPDNFKDDISFISEITGTSFSPHPPPAQPSVTAEGGSRQSSQRSRADKRHQQKQRIPSPQQTMHSIPAQKVVRKLNPILRNKNRKYQPTVTTPDVRHVVTFPAVARHNHLKATVSAADFRKLKAVKDDDSREAVGDYLTFGQLLTSMTTGCSGRPGGLEDLIISPSHSLDDDDDDDDEREGDEEDNDSYFGMSMEGSTYASFRTSSSNSTAEEDFFSLILCGSGGKKQRKAWANDRLSRGRKTWDQD